MENIDLISDVSITTKGSFSAVFIGTIISKAGFEGAEPSTIQILKARSNGDISSPAAQNENQGFIGGKAV